uniref:Uncharacterized protein B9J10.150 n=1 Tax=Neurospora crassa TaxID=5141 RepID=Q9P566_NEUCS|nr:hypothetical protein [Neurospora crassa]
MNSDGELEAARRLLSFRWKHTSGGWDGRPDFVGLGKHIPWCEKEGGYLGNAQLECQRHPLSPALCGPGSNFLQQYNQCQSCIENNSNNPEPIKASLAMRFKKCTAYCNKLQASISAPPSATQTKIPTAGQDGDPFTTATIKTSSTSSTPAIQTIITTSSLNVDYKGETTIVTSTSSTSTLPATTMNPPTLPTTSTSTPQQSSFTLPSSSSSSKSSSTSTPLTTSTILDTTTTTTQTQTSSSLTSPTDTDTSLANPTLLPLQPSSDTTYTDTNTNNTKTAPWVWVIVGITITVVFLLSSGSFFLFYNKGRSKRERRQTGMKGMVELKETTTVGNLRFGDAGWGSDAACFRTGTGTGTGTRAGMMRRAPDEAGGPGSNVMPELEGSGSGGGWGGGRRRGVGGIITKGNGNGNVLPPVEMPSCGNGFAELPTEFNRRKEELVK